MMGKIADFLTHAGYRHYVVRRLLGFIGLDLDGILRHTGYSFEALDRVELYRAWEKFLSSQPISEFEALEISPGENSHWAHHGFKTYTAKQYPDFDICSMKLPQQFDLIIADNVFEHLQKPYTAAKNIFDMLKSGGIFLISTPFLIRVHGAPYDFNRWTEDGMHNLLEESGFQRDSIFLGSWGNRKAVKASLNEFPCFGWGKDMRNEPEFPVMVWAIARR
jgi:hypothetical protein